MNEFLSKFNENNESKIHDILWIKLRNHHLIHYVYSTGKEDGNIGKTSALEQGLFKQLDGMALFEVQFQ